MTRTEPSLPLEQMANVLLAEGQDDGYLVEHLCRKRFGEEPPFDVVDEKGCDSLRNAIPTELKAPDRQAVGIVVDANDDPDSRWRAARDGIRRTGIPEARRRRGKTPTARASLQVRSKERKDG